MFPLLHAIDNTHFAKDIKHNTIHALFQLPWFYFQERNKTNQCKAAFFGAKIWNLFWLK